jgi:dienelactone hydrolase
MKTLLLVHALLIGSLSASAEKGVAVPYDIEDKPYEGYYVHAGKNAPIVLLIHDWDGLTGYEKKRADILAKIGYSVFAADLFGAGVRPTTIEAKRKLTGALYNDREKMRQLMRGALREAYKRSAKDRTIAAMGYCFGGAAVLELARSGEALDAFVTFHGGLDIPDGQDYSNTNGKILIIHGTADNAVSMDTFAALADALESAGVEHEMITYGKARHAFTVFGSDRYNETADTKSWRRFTEFLENVLKK